MTLLRFFYLSCVLSVTVVPLHVLGHGGNQHVDDENGDSNKTTGCGVDWGCLDHSDGCSSGELSEICQFRFKWRQGDGRIHFVLRAVSKGYLALGISQSGEMTDSEVYSCSSEGGVLRGWNNGRSYTRQKMSPKAIFDENVTTVDGVISCEFKRVMYLVDGDDMFLDLRSGNNYTVLAAWYDENDEGAPEYHGENKQISERKVDFTVHKTHFGEQESEFLPKLHGILMTLAWLGFATIGVTSARYYKPIWPETTLWGTPVWFSIHRTCMVSALSCSLIAAVIIVIHVKGYILPSEGTIRFLHAVLGSAVIFLSICNAVMAIFRPHPGTKYRPIYNWAHWSVGTLTLYLALATILLGVVDFEGDDALLGGIPDFVFWIVAVFIVFHLIIWMSLQYISVTIESTGRENDLPLINELDESEKVPINPPVSTSASARMKQLLLWAYITGVITVVLVVVIGIIIAKDG